ncbi:MAG: VOC family protein [Candidatus Bathyarchaeota archaeon]|nr:VOC family protein [Candidatus Bathyarchaeota archaeon]
MKGLKKIDAVMHRVDNLEESARFYEEVMGLKVGWTDPENAMIGLLFPGNDTELVLHMDTDLPNPNVSFQVESVEEFISGYKAKGYNIVVEPFDIRCGKCAILADPSGNSVEIMDLTKFDGKPRYDK